MKKIGLFINSTITVADFEKIAKPFLGNEEIELFSNFEHPSVNFIERKSTLSFQTNASLRKKISELHEEYYNRFQNTPLCNDNFNFWTHLRFNSYLHLITYNSIKEWVEQLKKKNEINKIIFLGVNKTTKNLIQYDYENVSFISGPSDLTQVGSKKITLKLMKAILYGSFSFFSIFRRKRENLFISLEGSLTKINTKEGYKHGDKFMYYLKDKLPQNSYNSLLNVKILSKSGLKDYSVNSYNKYYDYSTEKLLFPALFRIKFYTNILRARSFYNKTIKNDITFLGVLIRNNNGGLMTELVSYWSYYFFFKKTKYKNVLLVSEMSPESNSITRVAKQLGINVIGIQHGLLNENNIAYNYSNEELKFDNPFPNKLVVWGNDEFDFLSKNKEVLKDTIQPLGNIVLDGIKYLPKKKKNSLFTILYASQPQPIMTNRMKSINDFVDAVLQFSPNEVKIIIRLHPREVRDYSLYLDSLKKLSNYNIEIDKGEELFGQLNKADVIVTSYSTVARDALILYKPIILQDYSGIDVTGLLNTGIASNTINSDELLVELKKIKDKEITIDKNCFDRVLSASYASLDFNVAQKIVELLN